jgi:hypothetical protein
MQIKSAYCTVGFLLYFLNKVLILYSILMPLVQGFKIRGKEKGSLVKCGPLNLI